MSVLRRATTWEISESEDSDHDRKSASKPGESRQDSRGDPEAPSAEEDPTNPPPPAAEGQPRAALSPPRPDAPGAARRRRSKEQVEAERRRAEERKEERERRRAARAREKEERRQEQRRRREAADELKSLRPENCIRSLTVCVEPTLLQHEGSDILLDTLAMLEWRCAVESRPVPGSITWTRDLPQQGDDARLCVDEEPVVLVLTAGDFVDVVIAVKKMADSGGEETAPGTGTVLRPLWECLNQGAPKAVTMLVTDFESDHRTKGSGGRLPEQRPRSNLGMKNRDLEEVLVYLQLYKNISVLFLESWQDVTDHVCAVTKALSKRPFRLLSERCELPFCVDGSWASGARVERDGSGLGDVWGRQIQQLNRVSPAVAEAVTAAFPSPRLLLQAYQSLGSEAEKKGMLAGLSVRTEGKERRIGPDVSSRVYRCLTAENPQLVLD